MSGPLSFACEDGIARLLGSFDGRDRRTLYTHSIRERPEQLLVSIHEQLHEELHWSTAWGLLAAMAGLLQYEGCGPETLGPVALLMNNSCREVHELFATTVSCGAVGVPRARELLVGNPPYLGYLQDGLALGGAAERWPWQFRESAIQMLLRTLMQPAELSDIAEKGFTRAREQDLMPRELHPDVRLEAVRPLAAGWWEQTFAQVWESHPQRGGDTGGVWARELPDDAAAMEQLKAWEETVLIPALGEAARARMRELGIAVLAQDEYLQVAEELRASFLELAPEDWQVEVFAQRRLLNEEMLGGEREGLKLADSRSRLSLCDAEELSARATEFLLDDATERYVLALLLDRAVLHRQFAGLDTIPDDGPPLLANRRGLRSHLRIAIFQARQQPTVGGAVTSEIAERLQSPHPLGRARRACLLFQLDAALLDQLRPTLRDRPATGTGERTGAGGACDGGRCPPRGEAVANDQRGADGQEDRDAPRAGAPAGGSGGDRGRVRERRSVSPLNRTCSCCRLALPLRRRGALCGSRRATA